MLGPAGPVGWPAFLPDGHHFFIMASVHQGDPGNKYGIYLSSIEKPAERRLLVPLPSAPAFAADHLLFVKDGTLMAQAFDPARLELTGDAVPIVDGAWYFRPNGQAVFSAAGDTVAYMTRPPDVDLLWTDAHGSPIESMGPPGQYGLVAVWA